MFCGIHLGAISQPSVLYNEFEKCTFKITATSHRDLKLNSVYLHLQRRCCRISVDEGKVSDNLDLLTH